MRMWMIDASKLCRQHLLGEHGEIHKHRHNFVKKHKLYGRIGQIEPESMQSRHDELAKEMVSRGYNHKSPYEQPDVSYLGKFPKIDLNESQKLLYARCEECKRRENDTNN